MDQFDNFYAKSLKFLSFRQRSEKEIRDYLKKKEATPEIAERVITLLKEHKFLNDEEFARIFIESRNRARPRAQKVLKMELKQKGIGEDIYNSIIQSPESKIPKDIDTAKAIVRKRLPRIISLEKDEIYKKLGGFLARRGYDWDTVKRSIDDCLREEYNTK